MDEDIRQVAIHRGIAMIRAAGALVAVRLPDGTTIGDELMVKKAESCGRDTHRFDRYKVGERLACMAVGDVKIFNLLEGTDVTISQLQSNISSWANKLFGSGAYITRRNEGTIEVLRVA